MLEEADRQQLEMRILGRLILNQKDLEKASRCRFATSALRLDGSCFANPEHAQLYTHILQMHDFGVTVDVVTLVDWLADRRILDEVGGSEYVLDLIQSPMANMHIETDIELLCRAAKGTDESTSG